MMRMDRLAEGKRRNSRLQVILLHEQIYMVWVFFSQGKQASPPQEARHRILKLCCTNCPPLAQDMEQKMWVERDRVNDIQESDAFKTTTIGYLEEV
ncbi:hypothetical protein MLD38_028117 [Melastoma candidum]|uniref:Uncharacterized protein n=1 Tax=Melastoma candidum TaxID=119954 RepID=A0ACB9N293_9MYRT|nr:hypothetical protein MLD38_028117 [Melastoma candidum]